MTTNLDKEINIENENNNPSIKKDEEMSNLLKKLDIQIEENKNRNILNLPSYTLELDLDFDDDSTKEQNIIKKEEKKEIINVNNNENKNDEIKNESLNLDNISEKKEDKLKNKNIKETIDSNGQNEIIKNNKDNSKISNKDKDEKKSIENNNNIENNINKEEINKNGKINQENNINKKENENNKNKESESDFDLLLSDEDKEENAKKEQNNINNNAEENKNSQKEKEEKEENNSNKNNKSKNILNKEDIEQKENKKEISKQNSDSIYEDFDPEDEFQQENNNNINNNLNNNKENKEKPEDKKNIDIDKNEKNENNNKKNDINDNKSENETKEIKEEENKINKDLKNNNNSNEDLYSNVFISDKEEQDEKKSERSQKSKSLDKSNNNNESKNDIDSNRAPAEIPQVEKINKMDDNNNQENIVNNNANINKSVDDLSDELKNKLKNVVDKINNFRKQKKEYNKDELEKYSIINLDFNYKEKSLDDLIPSLKSKIEENETSKEIEKRKHDFFEHIYYEGGISTNPLLDIIPYCKISHNDLMKNIYEKENLKNIPKIFDDNYKKKIFQSGEGRCKIYPVENLENFLYKYRMENNKKISMKSYKYFTYWRNIEGDGNSFFRVAMFAMFENFILKNSIEALNLLIGEISCDRFVKIYKENNVNYEFAFYIFSVILHLLQENKIEEAYSIFVQSYSLKDDAFDKILIIYLRNICFDYTDEALELCKDEEVQKEFQIQPQFINKELIKTMNIEPDFFIVCLMPYLFDINISIYWIDQDLLKPKEGLINFTDEENPESLPYITLGYFYSSYHRIYSRQWYEEENIVQNIFNKEIKDIKNLTYEFKSIRKCNVCKNNIYIAFFEKKIRICKNCLDDYINEISNERREALIKDDYIGKEYYSRPMKLSKEFYLNDFEFIEIKEEYNMINYLQNKLSVNCSKCKNFFTKRNLNNLKCKCLLCDKCLNELIMQITQGKKILNKYEKLNLDKIQCPICSGNFSYEDAIEHLKDIKESDKDNAIERMSEYACTLCLICGEKVREKKDGQNQDELLDKNNKNNINKKNDEDNDKYTEIIKYKIINLKREGERNKGIDYIDTEHVICINCFEKSKIKKILDDSSVSDNDDDNSERKFFINFEKGVCFCRLCYKKHTLSEKTVKNAACCTTAFCSLI